MILIWRGWGLLAVVVLFPLLASCGGLTDVEPRWLFQVANALCLLVAGVICVHFGTRWNRPVVEHSFWFIPLQIWGWIYTALAWVFVLSTIASAFQQGIDKPKGTYQLLAGGVGLAVVVVVGLVLIRSVRSYTRTSARARTSKVDLQQPYELYYRCDVCRWRGMREPVDVGDAIPCPQCGVYLYPQE